MDDIINRLRKLKDKKTKKASPLEDFFEPAETEIAQPETDIGESGLDIKPLGKTGGKQDEIDEQADTGEIKTEMPRSSDQSLAKGIRELSFDDLEESPEEAAQTEEEKAEGNLQHVIELITQDPNKIKHLKLIVALLEAEQFEAAHQEIDNMITM